MQLNIFHMFTSLANCHLWISVHFFWAIVFFSLIFFIDIFYVFNSYGYDLLLLVYIFFSSQAINFQQEYFKKSFFLIGGQLLYRILLFSVKPQHESGIGIHISPPCWNSLPSSSQPSRLIQSPCLSFLNHTANSHWLSILHMVM